MSPSRKALGLAVLAVVFVAVLSGVPSSPIGRAAADEGITADVVYRSVSGPNGTSAPLHRSGIASWTSEAEQADAGSPIRTIRSASSPTTANERVFVTQGEDGWLDAYVCTTTCAVSSDVGEVWAMAPGTLQTRFDVAYEQRSGQAILVYGILSTSASQDIAFRTYSGGAWSAEQYLDDAGYATDLEYTLIRLAARMGSDQIGLLAGESTNNQVNAWIWNGNAFGSNTEISASAQTPNRERGAIAWESGSGHLLAMAVDANTQDEIVWKEFTTDWSAAANHICGGSGNILRWLSLKANPVSTANDMVLAAGDDGSDLGTCYWTGDAWDARVSQDTTMDATATRSFDFAWECSENRGLLAYGTTGGAITYRTFAAPGNWSGATNAAMGSNGHAWVQLRTNPSSTTGSARILGAVLESSANSLGAISWNESGFTVIGADTFTSDVGTGAYESFDLAFRTAGTPGTGPGTDPGTDPGTNLLLFLLDFNNLLIIVFVGGMAAFLLVARRLRRKPVSSRGEPPSAPWKDPPQEGMAQEPQAPEEVVEDDGVGYH